MIKEAARRYYTYILQCSDGTYYTGWTTDIDKRLKVHNAGKGAKYTRARRPVDVVYYECFDSPTQARKREAEIKSWSRRRKIALISSASNNKPSKNTE